MVITKDAGNHATGQTGTSLTFTNALTVADRPNRLLLVAIDGSLSASDVVTGVSFDGVAMTKIKSLRKPTNRWVSYWYLLSPNTGTKNLTVTCSSSDYVEPSLVSYYNVFQQAYEALSADASGTGGAGGVGTSTQIDDGQGSYNVAIVSRTDNPLSVNTYRLNMSGDAQYASVTTVTGGASVLGVLGIGAGNWVAIATSWKAIPDEGGNPMMFQGGGLAVG